MKKIGIEDLLVGFEITDGAKTKTAGMEFKMRTTFYKDGDDLVIKSDKLENTFIISDIEDFQHIDFGFYKREYFKSIMLYLVVIDEGLKKGRKFTDDFAVEMIKKIRKLLKDRPFKETVLHETFLINEYDNKEFVYQ